MGLSQEFQEIWTQISSSGTSPMAQWLRICLAMQGTQVWSLFGELRSHMPWQLSLPAAATEPTCPGIQAQAESPCPKAEDHTDSTRTPHAADKTWGSQIHDYLKKKKDLKFIPATCSGLQYLTQVSLLPPEWPRLPAFPSWGLFSPTLLPSLAARLTSAHELWVEIAYVISKWKNVRISVSLAGSLFLLP